MKRSVAVLTVLVLALLSQDLLAQTAAEALAALKKLEINSCRTLSSLDDGSALDDTLSAVEGFLWSEEALERELLAKKIELSMQDFLIAAGVRRLKTAGSRSPGFLHLETNQADKALWQDFVSRYPEAYTARRAGGALRKKKGELVADIDAMSVIALRNASRSLKEAMSQMGIQQYSSCSR